MRGHVVVPFRCVTEDGVAIGNQSREVAFEVATYAGVGVFAQDQRSARVVQEDVAKPGRRWQLADDPTHLAGDLVRAPTPGWNNDRFSSDHERSTCRGAYEVRTAAVQDDSLAASRSDLSMARMRR